MRRFRAERSEPGFSLRAFVEKIFRLPDANYQMLASPDAGDVSQQITRLWARLTRDADPAEPYSSLIELPKPYVVPGGRFREMYYWDSYFTMLGLARAGETGLLRNMVDNFAHLVDTTGFIPNGTRSYFCTRSQPPFFVLMIELLAEVEGDLSVISRYLPQLRKEYEFWMAGHDGLDRQTPAFRRVVRVGDTLLNRYWDDEAEPRQDSYAVDIELASRSTRDDAYLYRNIRAACESGWDFSSRWFGDAGTFETICTTGILPVDLNSILYRTETVLADHCGIAAETNVYRDRALRRRAAIQSLFFDDRQNFFADLSIASSKPTGTMSLAAVFPLFFGLATEAQATHVARRLREEFLRPGGWLTTLTQSGQQWDAPNGWAPLQWMAFEGLRRYGFEKEAQAGARRWVDNNLATFRQTGRFMEKYNVEQPGVAATGGEYAVQDGFGWTNGVLLCLLKEVMV